jgi:hypothetical protein
MQGNGIAQRLQTGIHDEAFGISDDLIARDMGR